MSVTTGTRPMATMKVRNELIVGALILLPAIVKLIFYPSYPGSDDAFIHLAVAKHILEGEGWGIASIDKVNLSSSPVFTVLLLPLLSIGDIGLIQFFTVAFACAGLYLTFLTARRLSSSQGLAVLAVAIGAGNIHLWRWSGTVMEASLGFLLVGCIVWLITDIVSRRSSWPKFIILGAVVGVGTLTRFEIGLLLPICIVVLWLADLPRGRFGVLGVILGFALIMLPWAIFATTYFGSPIPTTFAAKASQLHIFNPKIVAQLGAVIVSAFAVSFVLMVFAGFKDLRKFHYASRPPRATLLHLTVLLGWPVSLFVFYYVKTDGLQSAARYFLPGLYTWPLVVVVLLSTYAARYIHRWRLLAAFGAVSVAFGLFLNTVQVAPVLRSFNAGYRAAMVEGAEFLRSQCIVGDTALIVVDIGIIANEGIGACRLVDAGALASPELRGKTLAEELIIVKPRYVVESIGAARGSLLSAYPQLRLVSSREYPSHSVSTAGATNFLNIYVLEPGKS